jgi:GcrA cell cycle regulator
MAQPWKAKHLMPVAPEKSTWTDDRIAAMTAHFYQGLSASQSAKLLGGATRNSVIGKRFRMGLILSPEQRRAAETRSGNMQSARQAKAKQARLTNGPPKTRVASNGRAAYDLPADQPLPDIGPVAVPATAVTFLDRKFGQCAFCIESPSAPHHEHMLLCGAPVVPGWSWCQAHFSIVFRSSPRIDRRDPDRNIIRRAA